MVTLKSSYKYLASIIAVASILVSGCQEYVSPTDCYEIEVVGEDKCRGGILVSVKSRKPIGETITYTDGKNYDNVILVFSEVEIPSFTKGYVQIRDFESKRDINCPPNYNTLVEVPAKVAVRWSEEPCRFTS
ncbi:hypothetical protein D0X99_13450 [Algoriphagus lacus]|uniref:Uncharacterized protein n=2 Tax=Algoriphagus lacus TaxID=2056311 RepID=A0A418PQH8_9BACT|nr:hypothetical protein D0X99_13450 [Algoriphagus lacus]